ncbi:hypothetical protein CSAL01_08776 [Colletotrichum salicis]|uniref:Protein HRI1 n=1 Tax=Colletotrichum salicis TaxID=1209931 RepID=A0A135SQL3_9PEZI|nr:hypothetical protein CSAL01_08776 [Colletotrichum salicis]
MPSQAVRRISIRWLPEPAYEDTDTTALNVGGYFIDLRSMTMLWYVDRAAATFRWTHIVDSLNLTVPDDAHFEKLPNGDDLEIGTTPCPHKDGVLTDYEEVWRDITTRDADSRPSWILQSKDGSTFIGKVGLIYLAVQKASGVEFAARREGYESEYRIWKCAFESGNQAKVLEASTVVKLADGEAQKSVEGDVVSVDGVDFVFRGVSMDASRFRIESKPCFSFEQVRHSPKREDFIILNKMISQRLSHSY